jgi:hypothetical protein
MCTLNMRVKASSSVRGFRQPFGGVVDDRAQAVGMGFQSRMKARMPLRLAKVGKHADRPQIAQRLHAGAFAAVAENHAMAVFEQTLRAMQADTLAGAGDEDSAAEEVMNGSRRGKSKTIPAHCSVVRPR